MNIRTNIDAYGTLIEPGSLKFQRLMSGPASRLWRHLTESDLRRQWLAAGKLETKVGAPVEFIWRNDELNDPPGQRPAGFPEEQRMQGRITAFNPARKLAIDWDGFGEVPYELEIKDSDVLLTVIQRGLPSRDVVVMFAAGAYAFRYSRSQPQ